MKNHYWLYLDALCFLLRLQHLTSPEKKRLKTAAEKEAHVTIYQVVGI